MVDMKNACRTNHSEDQGTDGRIILMYLERKGCEEVGMIQLAQDRAQ
jgi:hypothetical protein